MAEPADAGERQAWRGLTASAVAERAWCANDRERAARFLKDMRHACASAEPGPECWRRAARALRQWPYECHADAFDAAFGVFEATDGRATDTTRAAPRPYWTPTREFAARTNLAALMRSCEGDALWRHARKGDPIADYPAFHALSVRSPDAFWPPLLDALGITFDEPPRAMLEVPKEAFGGVEEATWLPGARLNVARCCLEGRDDNAIAVLWRKEGEDAAIQQLTTAELREQVYEFASALQHTPGLAEGSAVAIDMQMSVESVVAFLGIVAAGMVAVSIADSFASEEIATRLRLSRAALIVTQDLVPRGNKMLPLYARVVAADGAPPAVVVPVADATAEMPAHGIELRDGDVTWARFLKRAASDAATEYVPVSRDAAAPTGILFSSGTTGDPKAIPWSSIPPLRSAADAHCHQDVRKRDVVCFPTNLGWMMGPWVVYAALLNDATLALFVGAPTGAPFCHFVQEARVNVLGLVPSICKAWRSQDSTSGCNWRCIRCFTSSGEASNGDDYLWLSSRANYAPIIEYCGGTEIGGGFLAGSPLQPQIVSAFSTPTIGAQVQLIADLGVGGGFRANSIGGLSLAFGDDNNDDDAPSSPSGRRVPKNTATFVEREGHGELCVVPPMLGTSDHLFNRSHYETYFVGMPSGPRGETLRRHGDAMEKLKGGYYVAHGRCDDTMNLGGIKVSSVEIERACNASMPNDIVETAAFSVPPPGGGPERLVVAAVPREGRGVVESNVRKSFVDAVKEHLNPLFKVDEVVVVDHLPRTASNKIMRRELRAMFQPDAARRRHRLAEQA